MKIYIVTSGEYSDYKINGVFNSKEIAQKFIDSFKKSDNELRIEAYDLNPYEKDLNKSYKAYFIRMTKLGECVQIYQEDSPYGFTGCINFGFDIMKNLYMHVFAKDEKHAIKIINEKRTKLIALNIWK